MKFVYLDKKDRLLAWFTPLHSLASATLLVLFLALPLWHDSVTGRFMLEPLQTATIRARVPGAVTQLFVEEGQPVAAGQPLATLRNLPMQSEYEQARARLSMASERATAASLHYAEYGTALKDREQLATQTLQLSRRNAELQLSSPISGIVLTPRVRDLTGSYLAEGSPLLQVADLSQLRARIYVSEYDLYKVRNSAQAMLEVQGQFKKWRAQILSMAPAATEMDPSLIGNVEFKGMNPPHFYLVDLVVQNPDSALKPGLIGVARVYGDRRGVLGLAWEIVSNFWGRKLW